MEDEKKLKEKVFIIFINLHSLTLSFSLCCGLILYQSFTYCSINCSLVENLDSLVQKISFLLIGREGIANKNWCRKKVYANDVREYWGKS